LSDHVDAAPLIRYLARIRAVKETPMPLEFTQTEGNFVEVKASGLLVDEDYDKFVPYMEHLIERWGKLRMLFDMQECTGWSPTGAWHELKFQSKHRKDLKKVAVVGDEKWAEWATRFSKLFTGSDVRFFDASDVEDARAWILSGF
jgi:hypothetical protein